MVNKHTLFGGGTCGEINYCTGGVRRSWFCLTSTTNPFLYSRMRGDVPSAPHLLGLTASPVLLLEVPMQKWCCGPGNWFIVTRCLGNTGLDYCLNISDHEGSRVMQKCRLPAPLATGPRKLHF